MVVRDFTGKTVRTNRYTFTKGLGAQYRYRFQNGFEYWTTADGCIIVDSPSGRAEIFGGIPRPSDEEIFVSLDWTTRRWLRLNRVVAHFSEREGEWKGFRVFSDPIEPMPLISSTENFAEHRTRAIALSREFDPAGRMLIETRAETLRPMSPGEYVAPSPDPALRQDRFNLVGLAADSAPLPEWASAPARTLEVIAEPRSYAGDDWAAHDLSSGGFVLVSYQRAAPEGGSLISPLAKAITLNGKDIYFWWIGAAIFIRWQDEGFEHTLITTVPIDYLHAFLMENVGPAKAAESR